MGKKRKLHEKFSHYEDTIIALCRAILLSAEEQTSLKENLLELSDEKLHAVLYLIATNQKEIRANPQTLTNILQYASANYSVSKLLLLANILLTVFGRKKCTDSKAIFLNFGMSRLIDKPENELERLLQLMETDTTPCREQRLFDGVAHYLENNVHEGERHYVKGLIDYFSERALMHRGNPDLIFDDARLADMFNFKKKNKALREHRIIWMHLLNHNIFMTGLARDEAHDRLGYQWDYVANQALLQKGLDCYIKQTAEILQGKTQKGLSENRNLSIEQQTALLQISNELAIIGQPNLLLPAHELQTQKNIEKMESVLKQLLDNYGSFWVFKSEERKEQYKALEEKIGAIRASVDPNNRNYYKQIISVINDVRLLAIDNDKLQNKDRFFKLNRSGESRFLNTLNQMQDMVVRHWVQDPKAIQSFQMYKENCKTEFLALAQKMSEALQQHHLENYPEHGHPGISAAFFTTHKIQVRIRRLNFGLELPLEISVDQRKSLDTYLQKLKADVKILPGHLATLAKEVLSRGTALSAYLDYEKHYAEEVVPRIKG